MEILGLGSFHCTSNDFINFFVLDLVLPSKEEDTVKSSFKSITGAKKQGCIVKIFNFLKSHPENIWIFRIQAGMYSIELLAYL